ncbi:MAG TPA: class I SAM-dependent methyltransferase [Kiritimatiellia bacterium]|nr:class I SAM-dependent methyltransferase [Kiritimatiellia bacterium]
MIGEWLGKNSSAELTAVVTFADGDTTQEAIRVIDREADRAAKFLLYRDLLRCPESGEPLIVDGDVLQATSSGRTYPIENGMVDFLAEDFKTTFSIDHTDNISSWDYDQRIIDIITAHPDQLFLDCGAGLRKVCYPNVINYEIVKYSSTDVLGVAEKLPFADNSLDGVISVAVLEHVKDPFLSAAEMSRVLKPGGVMFCSVPFMQPLHGYPHHYYNMTAEGMKNLFPMLDIDEVYVPLSLHPIQSIRWMLFSYIKGLPEVERRTFENLKVKDIFQLPQFETFYQKEIPFIHRLSAEAMTEVAAGHCLIARKPM